MEVCFLKSGLMGMNVSPTFMEMTCSFLNCRRATIHFQVSRVTDRS
jgi:hypothetical protein